MIYINYTSRREDLANSKIVRYTVNVIFILYWMNSFLDLSSINIWLRIYNLPFFPIHFMISFPTMVRNFIFINILVFHCSLMLICSNFEISFFFTNIGNIAIFARNFVYNVAFLSNSTRSRFWKMLPKSFFRVKWTLDLVCCKYTS